MYKMEIPTVKIPLARVLGSALVVALSVAMPRSALAQFFPSAPPPRDQVDPKIDAYNRCMDDMYNETDYEVSQRIYNRCMQILSTPSRDEDYSSEGSDNQNDCGFGEVFCTYRDSSE